MFELIDGVRALSAEGKPVSVLCYVEGENEYEAAMAHNILAHGRENAGPTYVVLVGSLHAHTTVGQRWNPDLRPMAYHLRSARPGMRSLVVRHSGGKVWCCTGGNCGVHAVSGSGSDDARGIELFAEPDENGVDGVFDVGRLSASPPVHDKTQSD